jgi:DnaJ-class molecular chaperone
MELYNQSNNAWQKCPVCDGKGMGYTMYGSGPCNTCNGHGIISTYNGAAPNWQKYSVGTGTTTLIKKRE